MDKKGFTIIEVVVSFSILAVIMLAIIGFMTTYRDKVKNAEVETQLIDYKNFFMKIIYDEIIEGNYLSINYCDEDDTEYELINGRRACAYFLDQNGNYSVIGIKKFATKRGNQVKGLYIEYEGNDYFLPDSDLNMVRKDKLGEDYDDNMCAFNDFVIDTDLNNTLQRLKISYYHYGLSKQYNMIFLIN